jgi:short/branched chain acyl-CoA dehydrogenase
VAKFSRDVIKPLVSEMDAKGAMHKSVIQGLFDNGVRRLIDCYEYLVISAYLQFMAVEVPATYGGAEAGFFTVAIIVEELAKIDPSVSVMCDVQNTLVAPILLDYGTEEQKKHYLPRLHKDTVRLRHF